MMILPVMESIKNEVIRSSLPDTLPRCASDMPIVGGILPTTTLLPSDGMLPFSSVIVSDDEKSMACTVILFVLFPSAISSSLDTMCIQD